jgi:hypothetical protein
MPRFAQVRDNRELRDIRHGPPWRTGSRLRCRDVNALTAVVTARPCL